MAVTEWGEKYYPDERGSELELEHTGCGHAFTPQMKARCSECGEDVELSEIRLAPRGRRDAP